MHLSHKMGCYNFRKKMEDVGNVLDKTDKEGGWYKKRKIRSFWKVFFDVIRPHFFYYRCTNLLDNYGHGGLCNTSHFPYCKVVVFSCQFEQANVSFLGISVVFRFCKQCLIFSKIKLNVVLLSSFLNLSSL